MLLSTKVLAAASYPTETKLPPVEVPSPLKRKQSGKTEQILRILSYNSIIFAVGFIASYYSIATIAAFVHVPDETEKLLPHGTGSKYWFLLIWRNAMPCIVGVVLFAGSISVYATLSPIQTKIPLQPVAQRRSWKTIYLCLVTKGTNIETVLRSVAEMRCLLAYDPRIRFVVLTEQGRPFDAAALGVDVVFIPATYQPPSAKYKARALEYFRIYQHLQDDDWVLHLDEETIVDGHCLATCIEFIENTRFLWGQGLIMYNTINYWESALLTFTECLRFREDLGRFQMQHSRLHYTCWGCHGSFLLASGKIENLVGFDTACLAEDFWFADRASKQGYGGGWIPSIAREQSPYTFRDFVNQRKRWFCGMWQVGFWGKLMDITWILSTWELPLTFLTWAGMITLPQWLACWMHAYFSCNAFTGVVGTLIQDYDAGVSPWSMLWHVALSPILAVFVQGLQWLAIVGGIFFPPAGFDVVKKG